MDYVSASGGLIVGAGACLLALYVMRSRLVRRADEVIATARREADRIARDSEDRVREEENRRRIEWDRRDEGRRADWRDRENRLSAKEAAFDRKLEQLDRREERIGELEEHARHRQEDADALRAEAESLVARAKEELLVTAGLSHEEAAERALHAIEDELRAETAERIRKSQERFEEEAERHAQKVLEHALQRMAIKLTSDSTAVTIKLPDDDWKGRLIGREGRNIRTLEQCAGVDLIIDDTPGVVVVSCFENVRREVARQAIERLIEDGRIHPGRIEEVVAQTRREVEDDIRQTGRKVLHELDVPRVDPRIQYCLGRLKYRTSYGQNQLQHAVEVSYLAAAIAGEMGLNPRLAKRCGLFHDIGKSIDHELEGGHPSIGADLARRCNERPEVINAIAAHHYDVPFESIYGVIAQVADSISAARPGARRDTMERYIQRLERLEELAASFPGVDNAFAIQAGREIRVIVDAAKIDDDRAVVQAREIARRIEEELDYSGEIRVTVIRETRVTDYAR